MCQCVHPSNSDIIIISLIEMHETWWVGSIIKWGLYNVFQPQGFAYLIPAASVITQSLKCVIRLKVIFHMLFPKWTLNHIYLVIRKTCYKFDDDPCSHHETIITSTL